METATDSNRRGQQRIRIIAPTDQADTTTVKPPMALAEAFIRSFVASLQPTLATIIEKLGKEHLILLSKLESKKTILNKLQENVDVIPRSARIEFQITGSKRAEQRPEFIALAEETSLMVTDFRKALRGQVIKSLRIEVSSIEDEIRDHLLKAIRLIAQSYMIANKENGNVDFKVYTLMEFYLPTLLSNCPMRMTTFVDQYKRIHGLEVFPPPAPHGTRIMDQQQDIIPEDIIRLKTTIESVFITTWTNYKSQQDLNTVALELKKLSAGYFTDRETSTAVAVVDLEPAADKPELQALIRKETHAETKTIRQELQSLKQQLVN
jgi:hypothetical protein